MKHLLLITFLTISQALWGQLDTNISVIRDANTQEKISILLDFADYDQEKAPSKSIQYAKEALALSKEAGMPESQAEALYKIGFAYYQMNEYEEALNYFLQALNIFEKLRSNAGITASLNRIGNTHQLKGNYTKALESYHEALKRSKNLEDERERAKTYINLGSIYQVFGNYNDAIDYYLKARKIYEEKEETEGMAWAYLNLARLFKQIPDYDKALSFLEKSQKLYKEIARFDGNKIGVTLCLKEKGDIYKRLGHHNEALKYIEMVLEINRNVENEHGIANSLGHIGKINYDKGNYDTSRKYLNKALEEKKILEDDRGIASILRYLGLIHTKNNQYNQALEYFNKSLSAAKEQQLKEEIKQIYLSLSNVYSLMQDHEQSLNYYITYANLKDSLNTKEIAQREMQYSFDKKQRELELKQIKQEARLQRQQILTVSFIVGFLLMLIIAYVVYYHYKQKKRSNQKLAVQQKMITDSIEYARRIQQALLPHDHFIKRLLPEHFIIYRPKNIVSGDFYWVAGNQDKTYIAVADCTGHGVPGAFMSMLGIAFLNEVVNKQHVTASDEILYELRRNIIESLHQKENNTKDGMDIALCIIDRTNMTIDFSGAHNPLYRLRGDQLTELRGDRMPIGMHMKKTDQSFTSHTINIEQGDTIYMFSDGIPDQFGGANAKKFKNKQLKEILEQIQHHPLNKQKEIIEFKFDEWKGNRSQIDDVVLMGIRI